MTPAIIITDTLNPYGRNRCAVYGLRTPNRPRVDQREAKFRPECWKGSSFLVTRVHHRVLLRRIGRGH